MLATPKKSFETPQYRSPTHSFQSPSPATDDSGSCGRFIPSRCSSNLVNAFDRCEDDKSPEQTEKSGGGQRRFSRLLQSQLFGSDITNKPNGCPSRGSVYRYKPQTVCSSPWSNKENLHCALVSSVGDELAVASSSASLPKSPYKVLDAPDLPDDFYLNLLDWSASNQLAVGLGSTVHLWSAATQSVSSLVTFQREAVTAVAWSRGGQWLSVGDSSGKLHIFDVERSKAIRSVQGHDARIGVAAWGDGVVSTGSKDRTVLHRDLRIRCDIVSRLTSHRQEVCGLKWCPENQQLASGGNDNKVFVWSLHSTAPQHCFAKHTAAVKAVDWSPMQRGLLASGGGSADRNIRLWNTLEGKEVMNIDTGSQVCNLVFSRNSWELASAHGYSQNQISVWQYPSMQKTGDLLGHRSRVLYLSLSPDGQNLVSGAGDETLRFWKVFPAPLDYQEESTLTLSFAELR